MFRSGHYPPEIAGFYGSNESKKMMPNSQSISTNMAPWNSGGGNLNFWNPNFPSNPVNIRAGHPNFPSNPVNIRAGHPNFPPNPVQVRAGNPNLPNPMQYGARNPNFPPNPFQISGGNRNFPTNPAQIRPGNPNFPPNPVQYGAGNPNLPSMMDMSNSNTNMMALQHNHQYLARAPPPIQPPISSSSSYGAGPPPSVNNQQATAVFIKFTGEWIFLRFFDPDKAEFTYAYHCKRNSCRIQPGTWALLDYHTRKGGGREILIAQHRVLHESSNSTLNWAIRTVQPANQLIWETLTSRLKQPWTMEQLLESAKSRQNDAAAQANNDIPSSSSTLSANHEMTKEEKKTERKIAFEERKMGVGAEWVQAQFKQTFGEEVRKLIVNSPKLIQLFQLDEEEFKRLVTGLYVRCRVFNPRIPKRRFSLQQIRTVTFDNIKDRYTAHGKACKAMIQFHDPDLRPIPIWNCENSHWSIDQAILKEIEHFPFTPPPADFVARKSLELQDALARTVPLPPGGRMQYTMGKLQRKLRKKAAKNAQNLSVS